MSVEDLFPPKVEHPADLVKAAKEQLAGPLIGHWRTRSMKKGYREELGVIIDVAADVPCPHEYVWLLDNQILLCRHCFVDGT